MNISITKRQWNVSKKDLKAFDLQKTEKVLSSFNRACSGDFYMIDYFHQRFIIDSPHSLILCGHPKELADQKGFAFFSKILKREELDWILQMNEAAYKVLFNQPIEQREKSVVSYDLTVTTAEGNVLVLHHKVTPYQLCKNGNMWLGLCHTILSSSKVANGKATIFNEETGKKYNFVDGEFVLLDTNPITPEDMKILRCMVKGLADKDICKELKGMSLSTFKPRKRRLLEKLGAKNSAHAVHKAHMEGLI